MLKDKRVVKPPVASPDRSLATLTRFPAKLLLFRDSSELPSILLFSLLSYFCVCSRSFPLTTHPSCSHQIFVGRPSIISVIKLHIIFVFKWPNYLCIPSLTQFAARRHIVPNSNWVIRYISSKIKPHSALPVSRYQLEGIPYAICIHAIYSLKNRSWLIANK